MERTISATGIGPKTCCENERVGVWVKRGVREFLLVAPTIIGVFVVVATNN